MKNSYKELKQDLHVIELEERLETVQAGGPGYDGTVVSDRCDRGDCDPQAEAAV